LTEALLLGTTGGVLTPGEPERICFEKRSRDGIDIDVRTWNLIVSAGEAVGIDRKQIDAIEASA